MSERPRSLTASRDAPVGGQAVLEGVMMRGPRTWAVAYRPLGPAGEGTGELLVETHRFESALSRHRLLRVPVVRGVVALVESLRLGFRALSRSAEAQLVESEREKLTPRVWAGTVAAALAIGIGLFFLLPAVLTKALGDPVERGLVFVVVEKLVRVAIFLVYIALVSRMGHLQRLFAFHGAEHKTIHCHEAGLPLTPENAARFSRLHPRCGTSFMLLVMIVAIVVFAPLGNLDWHWLLLSRIVGIPLVAGLAFEAIKAFGRHRTRRWARILMAPGLQLQRLTTREPDHAQLAVAIAALEAVLAAEAQEGDGVPGVLDGLEVAA